MRLCIHAIASFVHFVCLCSSFFCKSLTDVSPFPTLYMQRPARQALPQLAVGGGQTLQTHLKPAPTALSSASQVGHGLHGCVNVHDTTLSLIRNIFSSMRFQISLWTPALPTWLLAALIAPPPTAAGILAVCPVAAGRTARTAHRVPGAPHASSFSSVRVPLPCS
jgi:hypothetical protein